jgi:hypothetical protein
VNKRLPILILLGCAALFIFGLVQLFKLRFEAGDVYPPYSSLRSDPLGTRAFYESLEKMPSLLVRRDFSSENVLPDGRETTYLQVAAERFDWAWLPEELTAEIDRFLLRGGRLAITFFPEAKGSPFFPIVATNAPASKNAPSKSSKKKAAQPKNAAELLLRRLSLKERWGVEFGMVPLQQGVGDAYQPVQVLNQTDLALPPALNWHSGIVFTNLNPAWQVIYARGTNAVVIERRFGPGSVVLASDSFFLSNEALTRDRHADLLAWTIGPGKHVFFDEAHLGLMDTSGVATLMRKYRLHGLAAGLMLLAALFIWKNSVSFVPPYSDEPEQGHVAGKDAAAGFVNLLRRNIAPHDVLRVCFDEWTKSLGHGGSHTIARVDQAQTILEAESARAQVARNPVRAYREICGVLRKHGGTN